MRGALLTCCVFSSCVPRGGAMASGAPYWGGQWSSVGRRRLPVVPHPPLPKTPSGLAPQGAAGSTHARMRYGRPLIARVSAGPKTHEPKSPPHVWRKRSMIALQLASLSSRFCWIRPSRVSLSLSSTLLLDAPPPTHHRPYNNTQPKKRTPFRVHPLFFSFFAPHTHTFFLSLSLSRARLCSSQPWRAPSR